MPDRRRQVGQRRRSSESSESRVRSAVQGAREAVSRQSGGREGIDARAVGDDRDAVDAAETSVDDEAAASVGGGPTKSRLQRARDRAAERVSELTALQRERLKEANSREAIRNALAAAAAGSRGAAASPSGDADNVGGRAAQSAQISSPMQTGLRPTGDDRMVSEMARSSAAEQNLLVGSGGGGVGTGVGVGIGVDGGYDDDGGMGALAVGFGGNLLEADDTSDDDASGQLGLNINGGLL